MPSTSPTLKDPEEMTARHPPGAAMNEITIGDHPPSSRVTAASDPTGPDPIPQPLPSPDPPGPEPVPPTPIFPDPTFPDPADAPPPGSDRGPSS